MRSVRHLAAAVTVAVAIALAGFYSVRALIPRTGQGRPCNRGHPCPTTTATTATTTTAPPNPWQTVIDSGFDADGFLPAPWRAYNFANSNPAAGYYLPSHVVVAGGYLSLVQKWEPLGPVGAAWYQGTIWAEGGPWDSVDHRTTVRLRIVTTGATSHRNLPLWWPNSQNWAVEGEEDYFESDQVWAPPVNGLEEPRSFFHYQNNTVVYHVWGRLDLSLWHTYRFQRLAHKITIWVDDMVTPYWEQQYTSTELPDSIKHPVFQQENPNYTPPAGTTGSEEIQLDWVTVDVPA